MRELIIGGARSGKSALAEQRALESGLHVVYVATAQVLDGEMSRRIAHHRARRPAAWGLAGLAAALSLIPGVSVVWIILGAGAGGALRYFYRRRLAGD